MNATLLKIESIQLNHHDIPLKLTNRIEWILNTAVCDSIKSIGIQTFTFKINIFTRRWIKLLQIDFNFQRIISPTQKEFEESIAYFCVYVWNLECAACYRFDE